MCFCDVTRPVMLHLGASLMRRFEAQAVEAASAEPASQVPPSGLNVKAHISPCLHYFPAARAKIHTISMYENPALSSEHTRHWTRQMCYINAQADLRVQSIVTIIPLII